MLRRHSRGDSKRNRCPSRARRIEVFGPER
uniref:Uncharacterized protein n=1 Tax=Siphoviridae sp. ctij073 TaxID=2825625 RepID=A0A8S5UA61_9CAUD|nr:MAG TPA: hypothetical protein [Siphoviridae sp. ctij073]